MRLAALTIAAIATLAGAGPFCAQMVDPYTNEIRRLQANDAENEFESFERFVSNYYYAYYCSVFINEAQFWPSITSREVSMMSRGLARLPDIEAHIRIGRKQAKQIANAGCAYWHDHPEAIANVRNLALIR